MTEFGYTSFPLVGPFGWPEPKIREFGFGPSGSYSVTYYLMRGLNAGGNYVHWMVTESPDLLAIQAPEAIPNLATVTIAAQWII